MQEIEGELKRCPDNKYTGHLRRQEKLTKNVTRLSFSNSLTGKTLLSLSLLLSLLHLHFYWQLWGPVVSYHCAGFWVGIRNGDLLLLWGVTSSPFKGLSVRRSWWRMCVGEGCLKWKERLWSWKLQTIRNS